MLKSLKIRNYAIIRESEILFDEGMNIITGETGAGKSILMGALGLILGERADSKVILEGTDKCVVEAHFNIESYSLQNFFAQYELDYDTHCIIRREMNTAGKSRAFINDTPVNLPVLKELGLQLVDIVSQHETLELNENKFQMEVLDAIAGNQEILGLYKKQYQDWKQAEKELKSLKEKANQLNKDQDYLNFVFNELQELKLQPMEQDLLEKKLDELSHADAIRNSASQAAHLLDGAETSVSDLLRETRSLLSQAARYHAPLAQLSERLESNFVDIRDVAEELSRTALNTQNDPAELERTENRLNSIYQLQKKHKVQTDIELIALQESFEKQLNDIGNMDEQIQDAEKGLNKAFEKLKVSAEKLSSARQKAIKPVCDEVNKLLIQVAMPNARFDIHFKTREMVNAGPEGTDDIEFLFTANSGFSLQPIQKVASGGELSRLMLCIKSLIANKVQLPTIVFDEIDTGISGEAAQKVAQVMKLHSKNHQVIAITHLPQIAGKASLHLYVYKQQDKDYTETRIRALTETERVEEIARMLSGENPSEKVLDAARELIGNSIN